MSKDILAASVLHTQGAQAPFSFPGARADPDWLPLPVRSGQGVEAARMPGAVRLVAGSASVMPCLGMVEGLQGMHGRQRGVPAPCAALLPGGLRVGSLVGLSRMKTSISCCSRGT